MWIENFCTPKITINKIKRQKENLKKNTGNMAKLNVMTN